MENKSVASSSKTVPSPKLPWQTRLFLSTFSFIVDASLRSNGTVNRFLINLFDFKASPSSKSINGVKTFDVVVDTSRNLWFRLYIPTEATTSLPVIFYFHGGGFVCLAANSKPYDDFCRRLSRELPAVIVSVNYRLAPEHRYPSQYEDGFDVLKFVDERGFDGVEANNADFSRCFLAGDSAGGNLAHHVAVRVGGALKEVRVIGLIAIQPFFGGEERTESETRLAGTPLVNVKRTDWMWKAFLPEEESSNRDHPAVKVFGAKGMDISAVEFPGTVVFIGGFDALRDWQKRYYEWLKKTGKEVNLIEYENAIHSFYLFPEIRESGLFVDEVSAFLQKQSASI